MESPSKGDPLRRFLRQRLESQSLHYTKDSVSAPGVLHDVAARLVKKRIKPREKTSIDDVVLRLIVGNPVSLTLEGIDAILDDFKGCRALAKYELRKKVCKISASDWIDRRNRLPEMILSGTYCRATGIRYSEAFLLIGGDVGHALVANGKTPLSQTSFSTGCELYPLDSYGLESVSPYWRPDQIKKASVLEQEAKKEEAATITKMMTTPKPTSPPPPPSIDDAPSTSTVKSVVVTPPRRSAIKEVSSGGEEVDSIIHDRKKKHSPPRKKRVAFDPTTDRTEDLGVVVKRHKTF